jgi:hypothetical protein
VRRSNNDLYGPRCERTIVEGFVRKLDIPINARVSVFGHCSFPVLNNTTLSFICKYPPVDNCLLLFCTLFVYAKDCLFRFVAMSLCLM